MSGVVSGNVFYNTESGLTPLLDRLTSMVDSDGKFRSRQQGYADAGIIPQAAVPQGIFSSLLGKFTGQGDAPSPPAPSPASSPVGGSPTTQSAPSLPSFAAAPGQDKISPNAATALAYFQDKGLPEIGAKGLVGGFSRESGPGLDPNAVNPNGGATGIAQWLGPRAAGLNQFAASSGRDPNDLHTQLDYAWSELTGPERKTLEALKSAGNPLQATIAALGFERPEGWSADNPTGAKDFRQRYNATVGLGSVPSNAMAYSATGPETTSTPAGAAIARIGAQANAEPGSSVMPVASAGTDVTPGQQPVSGAAPAAQVSPSGFTRPSMAQIQALVRNKDTESLGLKLWEQSVTGKDYGFITTPGGDVLRTDPRGGSATLVYRAPVRREAKELNGRLLDYDPQSGTARDATPAGMPQGYRPATPQERQAYGVQEGAPLSIGPDGKPGTLGSGVNQNVNVGADPLRKAVGDRFEGSLKDATSAVKMIPAIQTARQQLQAGIISGAGANQILGLRKIGAQLGVTDPSKIQNTETFRAATAPIVLNLVRSLGSGSGISDADRQFAERFAGGDITAEAGSISRMLDIQERAARAAIRQHNNFVEQLMQSPAGAQAFRDIGPGMRVQEPQAAAAQPATKTINGVTYHQGADGHWYQ